MQGRRIYPDEKGFLSFAPGDYGKDTNGTWMARPPVGSAGHLTDHEVTEHEDGTISVSPSILSDDYHGFLEHGVWREA